MPARELYPFSMTDSTDLTQRAEGDFSAYALPADAPEPPDPKGLSATQLAEYSDLIPEESTGNLVTAGVGTNQMEMNFNSGPSVPNMIPLDDL